MAVWPASLPQNPLRDGLTEDADPNVISTPVTVGPPKLRPLYSKERKVFTVSYILTDDQVDTLETFYRDTVSFGSLEFDYPHPRTASTVAALFRSRPTYDHAAKGYWRTSFTVSCLL